MGRGTIQQRLSRIKGRYRLFLYDVGKDGRALLERIRAYTELPQGQAVADVISFGAIAIIAFIIGQLSVTTTEKHEVVLDSSQRIERMVPDMKKSAMEASGSKIVASKKGKRWHYVWCPGAETISDKNKRFFKSEADAEKAGYTKASNCK